MPKKWKSSFARSLLLHGILFLVIALLVYHPHEELTANPPIAIESISIGKEVKKVIHSVVHSIGIPHQEPDVREEDESAPSDESAANESATEVSAQEAGQSPGSEMQRYLSEIMNRLHARKKYPKSAQFNEQEGLVQIRMEIAPDGRLIRAEVEKPCAFQVLNEAALDAVRAIGTLPPLPQSNSSKNVVLHVPIHFKIER